jgi:hypothetical protein
MKKTIMLQAEWRKVSQMAVGDITDPSLKKFTIIIIVKGNWQVMNRTKVAPIMKVILHAFPPDMEGQACIGCFPYQLFGSTACLAGMMFPARTTKTGV